MKRGPIFALLGANSVSYIGDVMSSVALPRFVLQTTGSAAKAVLTGAVLIVCAVLTGILAGPLLDRSVVGRGA